MQWVKRVGHFLLFNFRLGKKIKILNLYYFWISIIFFLCFSIHLCVTYLHTIEGVADRFLNDMRETVAEIMKNPKDDDAGSVMH